MERGQQNWKAKKKMMRTGRRGRRRRRDGDRERAKRAKHSALTVGKRRVRMKKEKRRNVSCRAAV